MALTPHHELAEQPGSLPREAAQCSGVRPSLSRALGAAPGSASSWLTSESRPPCNAHARKLRGPTWLQAHSAGICQARGYHSLSAMHRMCEQARAHRHILGIENPTLRKPQTHVTCDIWVRGLRVRGPRVPALPGGAQRGRARWRPRCCPARARQPPRGPRTPPTPPETSPPCPAGAVTGVTRMLQLCRRRPARKRRRPRSGARVCDSREHLTDSTWALQHNIGLFRCVVADSTLHLDR